MQRRENLRRSADELRKGLGETRQTLSEALIELEQMFWPRSVVKTGWLLTKSAITQRRNADYSGAIVGASIDPRTRACAFKCLPTKLSRARNKDRGSYHAPVSIIIMMLVRNLSRLESTALCLSFAAFGK